MEPFVLINRYSILFVDMGSQKAIKLSFMVAGVLGFLWEITNTNLYTYEYILIL